jgi:two-component system phosphate regulon sensor histidine kinase PhoR
MRSRIFIKLLLAAIVVIVAATAVLDVAIRREWERSLKEQIEESLRVNVLLFAERVNTDKQHSIPEIAASVAKTANARATVIDSSGKVLADTEADPAKMENHATRPEFVRDDDSRNSGSRQRTSRSLSPRCNGSRRRRI